MSNKAPKRPKPKKKQQKTTKADRRISPLAIVLALATLIGGYAAVVTLLPRVTASVSDPVDPDNPMSASVTIANVGYLTLDTVEPFFGLRMMTFGAATKGVNSNNDPSAPYTRFGNPRYHPGPDLGIDEKFTFGLNEIWGIQPSLSSADVAIIVQYRIPILHLKQEKDFSSNCCSAE